MIVDMSKFLNKESKILGGRREGLIVREKLGLDSIDETFENVTIVIPEFMWCISSGFFLNCFGPSIRLLGENRFRRKYKFECNELFMDNINDGIYRAINTSWDL